MNRDDIITLAREAGFTGYDSQSERLHAFAALVAAAEREACAKVCERYELARSAAAAIRARGNT